MKKFNLINYFLILVLIIIILSQLFKTVEKNENKSCKKIQEENKNLRKHIEKTQQENEDKVCKTIFDKFIGDFNYLKDKLDKINSKSTSKNTSNSKPTVDSLINKSNSKNKNK